VETDYGNGTSSSGGERTIHKIAKAGAVGGEDEMKELSRELLSRHVTISEFEGISVKKCMVGWLLQNTTGPSERHFRNDGHRGDDGEVVDGDSS
jgi:hypothetical protein